MGNEASVPDQRHVSFANELNDTARSNYRVTEYDVAPQMRSRESTLSLGHKIQDRAQRQKMVETVDEILEDRRARRRSPVRMDIPSNDWEGRSVGGTRTQTRTEWHEFNNGTPNYNTGWRTPASHHNGTYRTTTVINRNRPETTEEMWYHTDRYQPRRTTTTRSFQMDNFLDDRSPSRAFNTRDSTDPWYHYKPTVNKRADWALVGRHVLSRPISARQAITETDFRRLRDFDTFSDPTPMSRYGGVRPTNNPRIPRTERQFFYSHDDWYDQPDNRIRRPPVNTFYQTYSHGPVSYRY